MPSLVAVNAFDLKEMMKEIGAFELTPEIIRGEHKPPRPQPKRPPQEKKPDPLEVLDKAGLEVSEEVKKKIQASPEQIRAAELETIAEATELAMYQKVRCGGCKAVAELLAADVVTAWRPAWSEEAFLMRVQGFCESPAFPGFYQVTAPEEKRGEEKPPHLTAYRLERLKLKANLSTTEFSNRTLVRVCREHVDEQDTEVSEQAHALVGKAQKEDPELQDKEKKSALSAALQASFERLLCRRTCKAQGGGATAGGRRAGKAKGAEL